MTRLCKTGITLFSAAFLFVAFAQHSDSTDTSGSDGSNPMQHKMMDSTAMCGMMMMHFMKPSAAFEISDGFIVITGNKIVKYDSNLNVIREAEIQVDTTAMRKMMQQCPMKKGGDGGSPSDSSTGNNGQSK